MSVAELHPSTYQAARGSRSARLPTTLIMGARVHALTESEAVEAIMRSALAGGGHWTVTANLDHLRRYRSEPLAREILDGADLVLADGAPLVWASRLTDRALPERVAGSDLIWSICEAAGRVGASVFLLGGAPGAAERSAEILTDRFPRLRIAGTICPPVGFDADEDQLREICATVRAADPQIVFVGLGFPKQDLLIRRLRRSAPNAAFIGVGISFSFVAGVVARAPRWIQTAGAEWLYRLWREPRRLGRRYLLEGIPFAILLFASTARHRLARASARRRLVVP